MITNGNTIASGSVMRTEVCVVGSGAAGITLAWTLQKAGVKVILLEGSRDVGLEPNYFRATWDDKTLLYSGDAVGQFASNEPQFLVRPNNQYPNGAWERERAYGGTSTHWGGQSRPLDEVALEGRGPTYPAWPVTRAELDPFYEQAAAFCKLHSASFDDTYWAGVLGADIPALQGFDNAMYQYVGSTYLNFATRVFDDGTTIGTSGAEVIINATLLDINHAGGSVQSLTVGSMTDGPSPPTQATIFTVVADRYVLALGAVANARQLLLANVPNDNIGRYFMCHPLVQNYLDGRGDPITVVGDFLTAGQQQLLSGNTADGNRWQDANGVKVSGRFSPNKERQQALQMGSCWFWGQGGQGLYFEQAPNADSRVSLSTRQDPVFNQLRTRIDWQFSPADEYTYGKAVDLYREAVQAINPDAQVSSVPWANIQSRAVVNGHHLGTARMSDTPADGVVDRNLRSHDLTNLYVAGSSAWRTASIPNPTFSIIMFSLRLANHLLTASPKT